MVFSLYSTVVNAWKLPDGNGRNVVKRFGHGQCDIGMFPASSVLQIDPKGRFEGRDIAVIRNPARIERTWRAREANHDRIFSLSAPPRGGPQLPQRIRTPSLAPFANFARV